MSTIAGAKHTSINPEIATYAVNLIYEEDIAEIFQGKVYRKKFTLDFSGA